MTNEQKQQRHRMILYERSFITSMLKGRENCIQLKQGEGLNLWRDVIDDVIDDDDVIDV